jgi:hypothetical protein
MANIIERLQDFGTRSLITHTLMAASLAGAVIAGVFGGDEIARLSFVALLNFTAGLWVCQSIHAIGNPDYKGILSVVGSDDK